MPLWTNFIYDPRKTHVGWKFLRLIDRVFRGIAQVLILLSSPLLSSSLIPPLLLIPRSGRGFFLFYQAFINISQLEIASISWIVLVFAFRSYSLWVLISPDLVSFPFCLICRFLLTSRFLHKVVFMGNPISGMFILAALLKANYWVGLMAFAGTLFSTIHALTLGTAMNNRLPFVDMAY